MVTLKREDCFSCEVNELEDERHFILLLYDFRATHCSEMSLISDNILCLDDNDKCELCFRKEILFVADFSGLGVEDTGCV